MTETVIVTLIICVTVAFCIFFICAALSSAAKEVEAKMIEASNFIDHEEFEEYEQMVKERFDQMEERIKWLEGRAR
jgi:ABC-type uncharacterized transport system substrate-binding protein